MRRLHRTLVLALFALLAACAGQTAKPAAPEPRKPPTEPLAWVPADATVVARVQLDAFRNTPLWSLWTNVQRKEQHAFMQWIDEALVDEVVLGGMLDSAETREPSFVAALRGRFGAQYLSTLAARDQVVGSARGLLTVYERPEGVWAQVTPELLLAFSKDRADAVIARASQGPGLPVRDSQLFQNLAARTAFDTSDLAVLADDRSGRGRETLKRESSRIGLPTVTDDLVRAGLSIDMGQNVLLAAVAEAPDAAQAAEIEKSVDAMLGSLSRNLFVGMLGLRPVVSALEASTEGNFVLVRGSVPEADVRALFSKLSSVLEVAMNEGAPVAP